MVYWTTVRQIPLANTNDLCGGTAFDKDLPVWLNIPNPDEGDKVCERVNDSLRSPRQCAASEAPIIGMRVG